MQHELSCEYFLQNRKRLRESDALEDLPSAQDQFKWIQALALRIGDLEKQVQRLQYADTARRRNNVLAWLRNPACPRPTMTATEWFNQVLQVGQPEIEMLDHKDLTEVIKEVMTTALDTARPPLCAFAGTKTMYVWDKKTEEEESMWVPLTVERWDAYLIQLQHRFRRALSQQLSEDDEELRERQMRRIRQVNGSVKKLQPWLKEMLETRNPSSA